MPASSEPTLAAAPERIAIEDTEQRRRRQRRMAFASVVGTAVEWYDFYLYAAMASIVFASVFFPGADPQVAALQSFATFAVGFLARPIGGVVFGALGDHIGRKRTLVITFAMMGICTGLIGLLPDYATIGVWAPIALVLLRVLQGMGAGAEFASAAVASYEHADPGNRGRMGAWPALGMNLGLALSAATVFALSLVGEDFLLGIGWRIPFVLSFALVGVGLWVRSSVPETPEFASARDDHQGRAGFGLLALFRNDWRGLAVVVVIALGCTSISYIFKSFSLVYLTQFKSVPAAQSSLGVTLAGITAIAVIPFIGALCDRWSSKTVLIVGAVLGGLWSPVFLVLLNTGESLAIWIALIVGTGLIVPMMIAAQGSFYSRQFPVATRSSGVGTARELGTAISGAAAPFGALALVASSPSNSTVGVVVLLIFSAILVVVTALFDPGRKHSTALN